MAQVDPFLVQLPAKLAQDPQTGPYFQYLNKFLHDLWKRTGGGQDLITGTANLTADQTFSGENTFSNTFTIDGAATLNGAVEFTSTAEFTGTADFSGDVDINDALYVEERSTADTSKAGFGQLWVKGDTPDNLYFTDDSGKDYLISGITSYFKTATTSRTTTTTLTDDTDLSGMVLDANSFYKIEAYLAVTSASNSPDFKWAFQLSVADLSDDYRWNSIDSTGGSSGNSGLLTDTFDIALTAGETFDLHMIGYIRTNTAQSVDFQWAQNTSDATSTDLLVGSWIQFTKLGDAT